MITLFAPMSIEEHPDFIKDWKHVNERNNGNDPCSSGPLKYLAKFILNQVKKIRNYCYLCMDHDFDYEFGPKYGISKWKADWYLFKGIWSSGNKTIACIVWSGLTAGGWKAWNDYRRTENETF